jgi:hypothetical protein
MNTLKARNEKESKFNRVKGSQRRKILLKILKTFLQKSTRRSIIAFSEQIFCKKARGALKINVLLLEFPSFLEH